MSNNQGEDGIPKASSAKAVSTAATGPVLTYTCPTNKNARVVSYFDGALGVTVVAQPEYVTGGSSFRPEPVPGGGVAISARAAEIPLASGDIFRWNVTTALAASTGDFYIGIREEA